MSRILRWFARRLPGDTYPKKLTYWNLIQYIMAWISAFMVPLRESGNPVAWYLVMIHNVFFTNDGHIYGDLAYVFTGQEIRAYVWIFSMLFVVVLSYYWGWKHNKNAKYLRTASWGFTLFWYLIWTFFFYWRPDYDYAVWWNYIVAYNFNPLVILLAAFYFFLEFFGVLISSGYLIYKSWKTA